MGKMREVYEIDILICIVMVHRFGYLLSLFINIVLKGKGILKNSYYFSIMG